MPRIIITESALNGLTRCQQFIALKNSSAAKRAGQAIEWQLVLLESNAELGRPFPELVELRELIIAFGDTGYVALYRFIASDDAIYVLAFRHQKEAGY
ncbi:MAG TPA: type II toxin-antitoxin system RelE/ParE family toxin [Arenimonas sp.]|nr:type II toxin-antitoxin system RelE/ParE family toxin [Arenimonas sp.]